MIPLRGLSGLLLSIAIISQQLAQATRLKRDAQAIITVPKDEAGQAISQISTRLLSGQHQDKISFRLTIYGKDYILDLEKNRGLVASTFKEVHFSSTGEPVVTRGLENCYYHGTLRGIDNSRVVVSTCDGLSGMFYHGTDPDNFFFIEPAAEQDSNGHVHSVHRASDLEPEIIEFCGGKYPNETQKQTFMHPETVLDSSEAHRMRRDVNSMEKFVELVLVNARSQFIAQGSDLTTVVSRAVSIANMMDSLYKPLNTRIALVGVETWNDVDRISVVTDANALLDSFSDYHAAELVVRFEGHDDAQLLTAIDFDGATVGLAFIEGICSAALATGVIQDTFSLASTSSTVTHELGHNLGMFHDNDRPCDDCPNGCIMQASFDPSNPFTDFSTCSRLDFEETLLIGHGVCLFNKPTELFTDPICGNGFVESGEECDCGSPQECIDKGEVCCDTSTCMLLPGAMCSSSSPCCTNECQYESSATSCREKMNACDVEDFCPGDSAECSENLFLQNLSPCGTGPEAVCFNGRCETHEEQCQVIWGENATKAQDFCYDLNVQGVIGRNCDSLNATSFVPCDIADVQCGTLHCTGGPVQPVITFIGSFFSEPCQRILVTAGDLAKNLQYVRDGTICGSDKLCVNRKCVDFDTLGVTSCPTDELGNVCSGNGHCNNLNKCACFAGFQEPNCTRRK